MDFFTVTSLTLQTLHVFVIFEHGRRKVRHWATTCNPTMQWVIQQLRNAMPFGEHPRFMHRDNDGIYGDGVPDFLLGSGIEEVPTAVHCPRQNPNVKRPHQALGGEMPVLHEAPDISGPTKIVSTPVLDGLHHTYHRVAA